MACPLLALHRTGFVRPGRRRCLGQREPSSLSKVQSRSAGNRKAEGFQKSAIPVGSAVDIPKIKGTESVTQSAPLPTPDQRRVMAAARGNKHPHLSNCV